jgi:predicted NBD/HSP70 family sugar kinase
VLDDIALADAAWPDLHEAQRNILIDLLVHGTRSRAELSRRAGLSRATVTRLTRGLIDMGLVSEGDTRPLAGRGRPQEMLVLRPESAHFVGFKLTGDVAYVALTDLSASVLYTEEHRITSRDVESVVAMIADVVSRLEREFTRVSAIGVCLAGDVQYSDGRALIVDSEFLGWDEVPLVDLLEQATHLPTSIANDVQSLTAAHHWFGEGVGYRSMALIVFGAGVGCGVVIGDSLVDGSRGHPGRIEHLGVDSTGPLCDRGHHGCVVSYLTTRSIAKNAGHPGASYDTIVDLARAGDSASLAAFRAAGRALGTAIAYISNLLDVELVIVTGEGLAVRELAGEAIDLAIAEHRDPPDVAVPVEYAEFEFVAYARAAAIGAVRLVV